LLAAMLTVMLVATFSAAALWQQWRASEVEAPSARACRRPGC
jgi:general secretion pathway protein K